MSETWLLNETISPQGIFYTLGPCPFTSNNRYFDTIGYYQTDRQINIFYRGDDYAEVYSVSSARWFDENYRTIIFDEEPTGDLLEWLQDNAVKQEPPTPQYETLTDLFTGIANSIRNKKSTSESIVAMNFPTEIDNIPTGIFPSGTLTITDNGTYDVTNYANVIVNVSFTLATESNDSIITQDNNNIEAVKR